MTTTAESFRIPTPAGKAAELSRESYDALIQKGGLTLYSMPKMATAALILSLVGDTEPRTLREIIRELHADPEAEPSITEARSLVALVKAGLVCRVGRTSQSKYVLPVSDEG